MKRINLLLQEKINTPLKSFLFCFVILILGMLPKVCNNVSLSLIIDDMGYLATPSYLAGLDWSNLISRTSYYGYGLKWPNFIFFKMTDNYEIVYLLIIVQQILFLAACSAFFYTTIVKQIYHRYYDSLLLVLLTIASYNSALDFIAEGHIQGAFFLFLAVCLHCMNEKRLFPKIVWTVIVSFLLCFMITLHERCVAITIAFFIFLVIDWIVQSKCLVQPVTFIITYGLFYLLENQVTQSVIDLFWSTKATEGVLKNTSVAINDPLWFVRTVDAFKTFLLFTYTNMLTLVVQFYGIALISIVIVLAGIVAFFIKRQKLLTFVKDNRALLFAFCVSFWAAVIIIPGLAMKWGKGAYLGGDTYYKATTYVRYYRTFFWPAFVLTFPLWNKMKNEVSMIWKSISFAGYLILIKLFWRYTLPLLEQKSSIAAQRFATFGNWTTDANMKTFLTIVFALVALLLMLLWKSKKVYPVVCVFLSVIVFWGYSISKPQVTNDYASLCTFVKDLEANPSIDLPEKIYFPIDSSPMYLIQFMLPHYSITVAYPEDDGIILSERALADLRQYGFEHNYEFTQPIQYTELDNGLYFYVVGKDMIQMFEYTDIEWKTE